MKQRFTLIELLIVVAIIAILLSILLPSLSRAREKVKRAVCASNLSQAGKATAMFQKNNNGRFAPRGWQANAFKPGDPGESGTSGAWLGKKGDNPKASYQYWDIEHRFLNKYLGYNDNDADQVKVALCPSDKGNSLSWYDWSGTSYHSNTATSNSRLSVNGYKSIMASQVKSPTEMLTLMPAGPFWVAIAGKTADHIYLHTDDGDYRWNALYSDGHVAFMRFQWKNSAVSGDYNFNNN